MDMNGLDFFVHKRRFFFLPITYSLRLQVLKEKRTRTHRLGPFNSRPLWQQRQQ
jgi:hypothetical protein